jgi:hypothetical protein
VRVDRDGPLPPEFRPVGGVRAGAFTPTRCLVQRPVERDLPEVEADNPVVRVDRMVAELIEHPRRDPLIPPGPQRRVRDLALQDRFDTDPRTARHQADQDPPETQPVRDPGPVTAQRVSSGHGRDQRFDRRPHRIYHFGFQRAHDEIASTRSSGLLVSPAIKRGQHRRPVDGTYPRGP